MTIVFKLSDNLKDKVIKYYYNKRKATNPPYSIFQASEADTIITLYNSNKLMFQGISADVDANIWIDLEKRLNNRDIYKEIKDKQKDKVDKDNKLDNINFNHYSTIGSDEVGTGDYFGPIVVTASFVSKENIPFVTGLKVRDSKKLTDPEIMKIAPELMKKIPYVTNILSNEKYNQYQNDGFNMNQIKAILHNKCLLSLLKKDHYSYDKIVMDQFVYPKKYYEHIKGAQEKVQNITFVTKGEDKCLSIAVSSIISRYTFILKMEEISKLYQINIPKGAGEIVDEVARKIYLKDGLETLNKIAKLNFKNTEKIKG